MSSRASPLPPLYDRWMQECLPAPIPPEREATCHDCAMCQTGPSAPSNQPVFFDPASKCCTYMPLLWNFLVGALLEDDSAEAAEGRRTVEARIDAGVAVTPFGLSRPPVYQLMYSRISGAFGRAQSMRCPHFIEDGGRCGVWRSRESTCATWFCKYERGAVGQEFWERLHNLLGLVEQNLSTWCVLQLDPGEEALRSLTPRRPPLASDPISPSAFDHRAEPELYRRNWGRWAGKEREFYRRAGALVRELSWCTIRDVTGPEVQVAERLLQEAFGRLTSTAVPDRLRAGAIRLTLNSTGGTATTYSGNDPVHLSHAVLAVLPFFEGQPTSAALAAIREARGVAVTPELVRWLVDFGILVDATAG